MNRWLLIVNEALAEAAGNGCQLVVLVDPNQEPTEPDQTSGWSDWHDGAAADDLDGHEAVSVRGGFGASSVLDEAGLNPRYTFETFVKGARTSSPSPRRSASPRPGPGLQPAVHLRVGGTGQDPCCTRSGTTSTKLPASRSAVRVHRDFLNEYVDAIRQKTNSACERRYRDVDVLLIDDIQFMEPREGLQEEFFHTFNSLHGANKQMVISTDRMPDAIPTLEERLIGRFRVGVDHRHPAT